MPRASTPIRPVSLIALSILFLLGVTNNASAQYTNPYTFRQWNNPVSSYIDTILLHRIQRQMLQRSIRNRQASGTQAKGSTGKASANSRSTPSDASAPAADAPKFPITATNFKSSGVRLLPAKLANATPDITAPQKEELGTAYLRILDAYEKEAPKNNVAYALTFLLGTSMQITQGTEVGDAEAEQIARLLNDVLAAAPEFQKLTVRDKQAVYEVAIITGGVIVAINQMGVEQNDEEMKQQAKELAQSVAVMFGGKGE